MNTEHSPPCEPSGEERGRDGAELPFTTLLYRFLFFDWMFSDVRATHNLFERHAARVHNQRINGGIL